VVAALRPEHVAPLVAALETDYYLDDLAIHEAIRTGRSFNIIHLAALFKVDVFVPTRPFDQSALARTRLAPPERGGAVPFQLSSPEDIIVQKLVWYRLAGEQLPRQPNDGQRHPRAGGHAGVRYQAPVHRPDPIGLSDRNGQPARRTIARPLQGPLYPPDRRPDGPPPRLVLIGSLQMRDRILE